MAHGEKHETKGICTTIIWHKYYLQYLNLTQNLSPIS